MIRFDDSDNSLSEAHESLYPADDRHSFPLVGLWVLMAVAMWAMIVALIHWAVS